MWKNNHPMITRSKQKILSKTSNRNAEESKKYLGKLILEIRKHTPYIKKWFDDWGPPKPYYSVSDDNITPNLTQKEYEMLSPFHQSVYDTLVIYYNHRRNYLRPNKGGKSNSSWYGNSDEYLIEKELNKKNFVARPYLGDLQRDNELYHPF